MSGLAAASSVLPTGLVTFLLTDVEGSTRMWEAYPDQMRWSVEHLDSLLPKIVGAHGGVLPKDQGEGDSLLAAFSGVAEAVRCAIEIHRALLDAPWPPETPIRVRIGLHSGEADVYEGNYRGPVINRAARLRGIAHGGQTVISEATRALLDEESEAVSVRDLGRHRLKDITEPQHVFQIWAPGLPDEFPPLNSLDPPTDNLPISLTSFVGRRPLMEKVRKTLRRHRLVTLTGAGGSGKTRLALEVAADMIRDHPDGVWLIELAGVREAGSVGQAVASALGIKEEAGRPLQDTIVDHLRNRRTLLLYDNSEHLGHGAADLAQRLLESSRELRVLATGRQPLGIPGEVIVPVPPLGLPDPTVDPPSSVRGTEAVQLFVDRARLVDPDLELTDEDVLAIGEIARRLDGLPLAIELAAAMIGVFTLSDLTKRLASDLRLDLHAGKSGDRHHTLRATVRWSYDLMSEDEKELLRRLSVFEGGFDLEAAESVGGSRLVMSELTHLVEKSMVVARRDDGRSRFGMLETLQEFAREELERSGSRREAEELHLAHFSALSKRAAEGMASHELRPWLDTLERDHDNLTAALERSKRLDPSAGLDVAKNLGRYWRVRGHPSEGRTFLQELLEAAHSAPQELTADALDELGEMMKMQGDFAASRSAFERSISIRMGAGDSLAVARSKIRLGSLAYARGDHFEAEALFTEASAESRLSARDRAAALRGLGGVEYWKGSYDEAREHFEASLELLEGSDQQATTQVHLSLGSVQYALGDRERAKASFEKSLESLREVGDRLGIAACLVRLGAIALGEDDFASATRIFTESLSIQRSLSDRQGEAASLHGLAVAARGRGDDPVAATLHHQALRLRSELQDTPHVVLSLESYARFEAGRGESERAAVLLGAAEGLRRSIASPLLPSDIEAHEVAMRDVETSLGEAAFRSSFEKGLSMNLDEAVAYALDA